MSATVRQEYDDNINTAPDQFREASMKSSVEPGFLLNMPVDETLYSLRVAGGATYYWDPGDQQQMEYNALVIGRINHSFSSRLNIDVRERFIYSEEPQNSNGFNTNFQRTGAYIENTASGQVNFQWTPLFGTATSFTNDLLQYQDELEAEISNTNTNTAQNDFRFALLPEVTIVTGITYTKVDYNQKERGYESATGTVGADWLISPVMTLTARVGGTLTRFGTTDDIYPSPYFSAGFNWAIAPRTSIYANLSYSISNTDIIGAYATEAATITLGANYALTGRLTANLAFYFTNNAYNSSLSINQNSNMPDYNESFLSMDTSLDYKLTSIFDVELGYNYSDLISDLPLRSYDRNRVYVGVRASY